MSRGGKAVLSRQSSAKPEQVFNQAINGLREIHTNCSPAAFKGAAIRLLAVLTKKPVRDIVNSPKIMELFDTI